MAIDYRLMVESPVIQNSTGLWVATPIYMRKGAHWPSGVQLRSAEGECHLPLSFLCNFTSKVHLLCDADICSSCSFIPLRNFDLIYHLFLCVIWHCHSRRILTCRWNQFLRVLSRFVVVCWACSTVDYFFINFRHYFLTSQKVVKSKMADVMKLCDVIPN